MTETRNLVALFCDDIRQEVGNKYSLMGCYGDELIVEKMPAILSKLCVQLRVQTPLDRPFKQLVFRAYLNDDSLAEIEVPQDQIERKHQRQSGLARMPRRITFMVIMGLAPLQVSEASRLRVEVKQKGHSPRRLPKLTRTYSRGSCFLADRCSKTCFIFGVLSLRAFDPFSMIDRTTNLLNSRISFSGLK